MNKLKSSILQFSARTPSRLARTYTDLTKRPLELPETQARQTALTVLLRGTTLVTGLFCTLLLLSALAGNQVLGRFIISVTALLYLLSLRLLSRRNHQPLAAFLLVSFYIAIAGLAAWVWGINMPFATLTMSTTVTLAGILLGASYSLYAGGMLSLIILVLQFLTTFKIHIADHSWQTGAPSLLGEAIGYCLLFSALSLVSWLFGRQIEHSLRQARAAEAALLEEKKLLSVRLKERTEKLRTAQLKEMQQLYRFAELGQLSTALLHDLANHLTTLTLDIEDLEQKRRSRAVARAKQSIGYLDDLVEKVSQQIKDTGEVKSFNILHSLQTTAAHIRHKFIQADVRLSLQDHGSKKHLAFYGDPVRFSQVLSILLSNALEATCSDTVQASSRHVRVNLTTNSSGVVISVSDWGEGIAKTEQSRLFKPFHSSKPDGMGLGLFISKQIIETHFKGRIELESGVEPTTFTLRLPHRRPDDFPKQSAGSTKAAQPSTHSARKPTNNQHTS